MSNYQLLIDNDRLPKGYKQTEIGVIPKDWREVTVEDIKASSDNALSTGPFGSSISARFFQEFGIPVIRGSNLSQDIGIKLNDDGLVFISPEKAVEFKRSIVRDGDLIFTCWGTINQVGLIDKQAKYREYVISNKQMKFTPDLNRASSLFLYYLFSGPEIQRVIKNQNIGSSVPGFNLGQLRELRFKIPPLPEQRLIAHALSDIDALIAALDKLIAKKRYLKTATMQQLLTGKKRLPGFGEGKGYKQTEIGVIPEDWDSALISELTSEVGDGIHSTPLYSNNGKYYFVNGNNLLDGKIIVDAATKRADALEYRKYKKNLNERTVLLSINGTIGNLAFYKNETVILGKSAAYLNVRNEVSKRYFYYALQTRSVEESFENGLTGTTIKNLGLMAIRSTPVAIPKTAEEQRAIASILSDMDAEITALEARRTKTQALKQGMMQELLTGRTRLV